MKHLLRRVAEMTAYAICISACFPTLPNETPAGTDVAADVDSTDVEASPDASTIADATLDEVEGRDLTEGDASDVQEDAAAGDTGEREDAAATDAHPSEVDAAGPESPCDPGRLDGELAPCGAPEFVVVDERQEDGRIAIRIRFEIDGLVQHGLIGRPANDPVGGAFPAVIYQHGGSSGLQLPDIVNIIELVNSGYAVFAADYRGQTSFDNLSSEGTVEVCKGEVDDALAMLRIARETSWVDSSRVSFLGVSHGGCVTARMLQRSSGIHVAVLFAPGLDSRGVYHNYRAIEAAARDAGNARQEAQFRDLADHLVGVMGGSPEDSDPSVQAEWTARSPIDHVTTWPPPSQTHVLFVHGLRDEMITHVDTCRFVSAVGGVIAWRQRDGGSTDPATPDGCEPLVMQTTPVPFGEQWPSGQALFLHNTLNHGSNMIDKGVWFNMMDYLKKKGRIQR